MGNVEFIKHTSSHKVKKEKCENCGGPRCEHSIHQNKETGMWEDCELFAHDVNGKRLCRKCVAEIG